MLVLVSSELQRGQYVKVKVKYRSKSSPFGRVVYEGSMGVWVCFMDGAGGEQLKKLVPREWLEVDNKGHQRHKIGGSGYLVR